MPDPLDAAELLDIDVHELARTLTLVPQRRLEPDAAEPPHPAATQHDRDGRKRHRKRFRDLGPVIRNCSNRTITATRSAGVRLATRRGAEERSKRPASPSSR